MMPLPPADAPRGADHDPVTVHLVCGCQRDDPRLALCGLDVTATHLQTLTLPPGSVQPCIVCHDLARTVLVARRCERCAV